MKLHKTEARYFYPYKVYCLSYNCMICPPEIKSINSLNIIEDGTGFNQGFFFDESVKANDLQIMEEYLHRQVKEKLPNFVYQNSYSAEVTSVGNGADKKSIYKIKVNRAGEKQPIREFKAPYYCWGVNKSSYPSSEEKIEFFAKILEFIFMSDCELIEC